MNPLSCALEDEDSYAYAEQVWISVLGAYMH